MVAKAGAPEPNALTQVMQVIPLDMPLRSSLAPCDAKTRCPVLILSMFFKNQISAFRSCFISTYFFHTFQQNTPEGHL